MEIFVSKSKSFLPNQYSVPIPSNKEYSHICLLIFGYTELSNIRPRSAQGNYVMGSEHTTVKLNVNHAIFSYYSNNTEIDIPYHIYHFLPEFITENDLDLLSLSIDKWSSNEGNEPFELSSSLSQNVYYDKHRESKTSSIDCTMIIRRSTTNESARMVSGKTPMLSFDMGRVTLVSPSGEEITLQGTLEIKECSSSDFLMLCEFNKSTKQQNINDNEEDFDFDKEIEKDEKKRKGKNKNYLESLNSIKDTELYEQIMTEIEEVIKKYLD